MGGFHGRRVFFEVKLRSDPSSGAILAFRRHIRGRWEVLIDGRRVLMSDDAGRLSLMGEAGWLPFELS